MQDEECQAHINVNHDQAHTAKDSDDHNDHSDFRYLQTDPGPDCHTGGRSKDSHPEPPDKHPELIIIIFAAGRGMYEILE